MTAVGDGSLVSGPYRLAESHREGFPPEWSKMLACLPNPSL